MDDDWDLYAVVRSCTNSTSTAASAAAGVNSTFDDNQFDFSGVLDEKDDDDNDSFEGLEEIYKELRQSPDIINWPVRGEIQDQTNIINQQQAQPQEHFRRGILGSSSLSFPSTEPVRPRRRKNQQTKTVHQMTQEELSGDSWAWRKYGQKPIKGSPYPRNYYKCSTTKGCSARKQVERSPTDPNIFVVSYSGEHKHPRPTHRSSLAGSTRTKLSPRPSNQMTSSSSAATTPIVVAGGESEGEENAEEEEEEEEEDILIPNTNFITDDLLKGFQELSGGGGGITNDGGSADSSWAVASSSSCSLLSPPWSPTSSTTTTTTNFGAGGGGC